jgi:hypothetical protein
MTTPTTDWTRVSPATLTLWYQKLAYHKFEEDLTPDEISARRTYQIVTAILDLADPPSVQGYYFRVISDYHRTWLTRLPFFERIGHIEAFKTFDTGRDVFRLWLLSDWITTDHQVKQRKELYAQQSQEWMRHRVAFWFVYKKLRSLSIAHDKCADILRSAAQGMTSGIPETLLFLNNLGYIMPQHVTDAQIKDFHQDFRYKSGHVYQDHWDFTQPTT